MKKEKRRIICGVLALLLAAALPGCSRKMTAEELIEKMEAASEAEAIVSVDWAMDLKMGISMDFFGVDSTMDLTLNGEGNTLTNTEGEDELSYTTVSLEMEMFGTSFDVEMELYTQTDAEQNTTTYTCMDGTWTKSTVSAAETDTAELEKLIEKYQSSFTLAEEMVTYSEENISCYELQTELVVDDVTEFLTGYMEELDVEDLMDVSALVGRVFTVNVYVEENTYLPRYIEVTLAEEASGDSEEEAEYSFNELSVTLDLSYPEEGEIVIPDEALNAEEETGDDALDGLLGDDTEEGYEEGVPSTDNSGSQYESLTTPVLLKEYAEGDAEAVLLDESGVKVTLTRIYTDGDDRAYVDMNLTNDTSEDLCVYSVDVAVNHTMAPDSSIYVEVGAGETVESVLYIESLSDLSVQEIGAVSVILSAMTLSDYNLVLASQVLDIELDADAAASQVVEGRETLYEDDSVQIIAYDWEEDDYALELPVCIINKTEKDLVIDSTHLGSSGSDGLEPNSYLYADLFAESIVYTSLTVDSGDSEVMSLDGLSSISFKVNGFDMWTFDDVFATGQITVMISEDGVLKVEV